MLTCPHSSQLSFASRVRALYRLLVSAVCIRVCDITADLYADDVNGKRIMGSIFRPGWRTLWPLQSLFVVLFARVLRELFVCDLA